MLSVTCRIFLMLNYLYTYTLFGSSERKEKREGIWRDKVLLILSITKSSKENIISLPHPFVSSLTNETSIYYSLLFLPFLSLLICYLNKVLMSHCAWYVLLNLVDLYEISLAYYRIVRWLYTNGLESVGVAKGQVMWITTTNEEG